VPAWDDLLRDCFESAKLPGVSFFEVQGLPAGTYDVTLFTGDPSYPTSPDEKIMVNGMVVDMPEWPAAGTFPDDWDVTVQVTIGAGEAISLAEADGAFGKVAGMTITPEPATLALLVLGGLAAIRRRK
jgi:hypothetical protein